MSTFNIYKNSTGAIEAVKKGWSWPAFFFGAIWALVKGLYGIGGAIIIGFIVLGVLSYESQTADTLFALASIIIWIWLGAQGNELREKNLRKKGYEFIRAVSAESPEGAIASLSKDPQPENVATYDSEFYCDQCGAPAKPDAKFCSKCGVKFD